MNSQEPRNPRIVHCSVSHCGQHIHLTQRHYCATHDSIAAAGPELLIAVQYFLARADPNLARPMLDMARAAIAKAEGR